MADEARSRLGRGLAALIGDVGEESTATDRAGPSRSQRRVPVEFIKPNPNNPRRHFSDAELDELAQSIRERGIIQPIVVRQRPGARDAYEIIAGERRWRAAQRAGLHEVPIVLLEVSDAEALELAIIENVQRTDLNAIEEANGYQVLATQYHHSQDEIAQIVGKSRSHVSNTMRLLKLPETVQAYIHSGKISAGHARALIGQPNPEELAHEIVSKGMNVRQIEAVRQEQAKTVGKKGKARARTRKDPDTIALEKRLSDSLGLAVDIAHRGRGGQVRIRYKTLEQLDEVTRRLERNR
ncbi:MAG: ParB/RepB/Spo0J family partition protein [Pseudorhodoplanes sp.]|nr:ParB/RepB/Spo0J family partition protein [Pseudorhodoplanes sp.]